MITVEEVVQVDPNWWNRLIGSRSDGTVYQTTYWAEYFQHYYGATPYFFIARSGGTVCGLLLLFGMGRFPARDAARPWLDRIKRPVNALIRVFRWYGGPLVLDPSRHDDVLTAFLHHVDAVAARDGVAALEHGRLPLEWGANVRAIAQAAGFEVTEWGTFVIDLSTPLEAMWNGLKTSSARYAVKRAMKVGLTVYDASADPVDAHARCEYEHSRAHRLAVWPREWFVSIRDALQPAGAYRVVAAEYEGRPIAFTPAVLFGGNMHLVKPVQLPFCREAKIPAGDLLMWELIKVGHEQHLRTFDLGGVAPSPSTTAERQIRFFKSKWGGVYVTYPVLRKRYRWGCPL